MFSGDLPFDIDHSQCAEDGGPDDDEGSTVSRGTCDESIYDRENDKRVILDGNEADDELYSALTDEERDLLLDKNLKALHPTRVCVKVCVNNCLQVCFKLVVRRDALVDRV